MTDPEQIDTIGWLAQDIALFRSAHHNPSELRVSREVATELDFLAFQRTITPVGLRFGEDGPKTYYYGVPVTIVDGMEHAYEVVP